MQHMVSPAQIEASHEYFQNWHAASRMDSFLYLDFLTERPYARTRAKD